MNIVVADSGPIITFSRAKHLNILKNMLSEIIIPEAVYSEIVEQGKNKPGAKEVAESEWIKVRGLENPNDKQLLPDVLGEGEKEAIVSACELNCPILLDERRARIVAKSRGLKIISSLNILCEAKRNGTIKSVKEILDEFIRSDFRLSSRIYEEILQRAGEL